MDRVFLEYYEEELTHIRALAAEFADMHPAIARNLSLDTVPCPDPYVERLLDGVAFLAARTRLKVDAEGSRFARSVLEVLYPDLVAPAPAVGMAVLKPGQQVQTMLAGHRRQARHAAGLQPAARPLHPLHLHDRRRTWCCGRSRSLRSAIFRTAAHWPRPVYAPIGGVAGESALRITLRTRRQGLPQRARARPLDLCFAGPAEGGRRCSTRCSAPAPRLAPAPKATTTALTALGRHRDGRPQR